MHAWALCRRQVRAAIVVMLVLSLLYGKNCVAQFVHNTVSLTIHDKDFSVDKLRRVLARQTGPGIYIAGLSHCPHFPFDIQIASLDELNRALASHGLHLICESKTILVKP